MTESLGDIFRLLTEIREAVALQQTNRTSAKDVLVVGGLSDISEKLGLVQAGEFRTGNSKEPGHGFTGVRITYPAVSYSGGLWNVVGVSNDVLEVGISATDGKLYAGGGAVILDSGGIIIKTDTGAFLLFENASGDEVANIHQDGAGNLQIAMGDNTKAVTINDGNLIINHGTNASGRASFYENNVQKAMLEWDATNGNVTIENFEAAGDIILALNGGTPASENVVVWNRTGAAALVTMNYTGIDIPTGSTYKVNGVPIKEKLAAARTYYVRTDGSDSNTGLANTAGGAFLTVQKAVDTIAGLDIDGQTVTVQIADGTYTGAVTLKNVAGFAAAGNLIIQGNSGTPANVLINTTADCFNATNLNVTWRIKDMKLQSSAGGGIVNSGSSTEFGNINFGACVYHLYSSGGGLLSAISNYAISGAATYHILVQLGGLISTISKTVTLTGTPAITYYVVAEFSQYDARYMTFSGSATGTRYLVRYNAVVDTAGGGANYFPGNAAGSTATGGQYV